MPPARYARTRRSPQDGESFFKTNPDGRGVIPTGPVPHEPGPVLRHDQPQRLAGRREPDPHLGADRYQLRDRRQAVRDEGAPLVPPVEAHVLAEKTRGDADPSARLVMRWAHDRHLRPNRCVMGGGGARKARGSCRESRPARGEARGVEVRETFDEPVTLERRTPGPDTPDPRADTATSSSGGSIVSAIGRSPPAMSPPSISGRPRQRPRRARASQRQGGIVERGVAVSPAGGSAPATARPAPDRGDGCVLGRELAVAGRPAPSDASLNGRRPHARPGEVAARRRRPATASPRPACPAGRGWRRCVGIRDSEGPANGLVGRRNPGHVHTRHLGTPVGAGSVHQATEPPDGAQLPRMRARVPLRVLLALNLAGEECQIDSQTLQAAEVPSVDRLADPVPSLVDPGTRLG